MCAQCSCWYARALPQLTVRCLQQVWAHHHADLHGYVSGVDVPLPRPGNHEEEADVARRLDEARDSAGRQAQAGEAVSVFSARQPELRCQLNLIQRRRLCSEQR